MLSTRNLKAGDVLDGRYRLERRVGGGGMGDVWEGTDTVLWRTVAVKILLADLVDDRGFRERFRREAQAIAMMKGPGVVEVYDYGEIDHVDATIAYLIMEFVAGRPLSRLLGLWGKLAAADTLRVVGGVATALQIAHSAGIVHRDIKPGNILVRDDGSVVLVDFGIARAGHNLTLTTTGVVLGTVTYMSPEQAAGENLTPASDLYSLGVVAHQCLAGSPPFKADTPLGVLSAHLRNAPPPLPPDVPREVDAIIARALQKEPSVRWPNAGAFAEACQEVRAMITTPRPDASHPAPSPTRVDPTPQPGFARTGTRTGPRTGFHPVPPPSGSTEAAAHEAGEERPRRRGRLWATFAGALAVLGAAAVIAAAGPWSAPSGPGTSPVGETDAEDAEVRGQDADAPAPAADHDEHAPAQTGESDEAEASATTEEENDGETTAPVVGVEPTEEATAPPTPTESASPTQQLTVTVPDVVDQSESAARKRVEESDLSPSVSYEGEGDHKCGVVRQYPSPGTKVQPDSAVQITVEKAADAGACRTESDATPTPTPTQW
ncbi:protein kinase [Glycomyces sp. L485]|uniref:serine/threonine-protein kinase n=1 Tax=Glycomyces sp. L485 TaxID=2909235 RepID=UPI001F4ACCDA|nr:serine/threonine-protein kinase [Glycomyces sp. L485]MCH7232343.1 protein kinase [Glycomyces sp. L485]